MQHWLSGTFSCAGEGVEPYSILMHQYVMTKEFFSKINFWALAIIALQIAIIWLVIQTKAEAEEASQSAYLSQLSAEAAADDAAAIKSLLK